LVYCWASRKIRGQRLASPDRSLKVVKLFVVVEEDEVLGWEVMRKCLSEVKRREIVEGTFGLLYVSMRQRIRYDV
jgi:hypothetical protein